MHTYTHTHYAVEQYVYYIKRTLHVFVFYTAQRKHFTNPADNSLMHTKLYGDESGWNEKREKIERALNISAASTGMCTNTYTHALQHTRHIQGWPFNASSSN